jgi:hypothetical protein
LGRLVVGRILIYLTQIFDGIVIGFLEIMNNEDFYNGALGAHTGFEMKDG